MIKLKDAIYMDEEMKKLEEKYLEAGKVFTAVRDLPDYEIDKGDMVKISPHSSSAHGYFEIINMETDKHFRIYSLEFVKNFR